MGSEPLERSAGEDIAPGSVLARAVGLVFRNLGLLTPLALLAWVPFLLDWCFWRAIAPHPLLMSPIRWGGIFLASFAEAAMIVAVSERDQGKEIGLLTCLRRALSRFPQFFMADVLYVLIWVAGLLLVIVPGVIWHTTLSMAPLVALLEERGEDGPLRRSRHLVRGRFWRVLIVLLPLTSGWIACFLISRLITGWHPVAALAYCAAGAIFIMALSVSVRTVLYHRLLGAERDGGPHGALPPYSGCVPGCVAACGLMVGIGVMLAFWTFTTFPSLPHWHTRLFSMHQMELVKGLKVPTPEGWLAVRLVTPTPVYSLYRSDFNHNVSAWAFVAPLASPEQKPLKLDSPDMARAAEEGLSGIPFTSGSRGAFETLSIRTLEIGGRLWGECAARRETGKSKRTQDRILLYTPVDANLLVIADTHEYLSDVSDVEKEQGLEAARQETRGLARALLPAVAPQAVAPPLLAPPAVAPQAVAPQAPAASVASPPQPTPARKPPVATPARTPR